ncbi:hypothetical protein H1C71_007860, partial [Ictidomys tridecemlineatus]
SGARCGTGLLESSAWAKTGLRVCDASPRRVGLCGEEPRSAPLPLGWGISPSGSRAGRAGKRGFGPRGLVLRFVPRPPFRSREERCGWRRRAFVDAKAWL